MPGLVEQVYYHCAVREEEEEKEQQLQVDAPLKGRQCLQHGKDGNITSSEAPSFFSSVGEQPLPKKEEVLHRTHKEEQKEQPTQKVEETNNVVAENGDTLNDDSETVGLGIIAEIVENAINGETISSASINFDASQHKNSVYLDKQQAFGVGDASIEGSITDPASIEDSRIDIPESSLANIPISHGGVDSSIPSIVKSVVKIESRIEKGKKSNVALQNEPLVEQNDSRTQSSSDVEDKNRDSVVVIKTDISNRDSVLLATVATTENVRQKNRDLVDVIKTDVVANISKPYSVLVAAVATTEVLFNAGKPAQDDILKPYEVSPIFDKGQKDVLEIAQDSYSSLRKEAQSRDQSLRSEVVAKDVARDKQNFIVDTTIPSIQDFKQVQKGIEEEIKPSVAKEKEEAFKTSTSQAAYVPIEEATVTKTHTEIYIGEQPRAEIGEHQESEMLKSIVYGGLVESITSLGVVSSASSSGASPLNIIAFGLASILGGLFVIGHNLNDLKNGHSGGHPLQINTQQDRYQELLGRRENFILHFLLAVLSFLIFGSVPLGVYGLLISMHNYDEVKISAVTASSVVCIILLAMAKAYTSRPPKSYVKTVLHYVALALATSGISYLAGDLVKKLLDKISGSQSGYVLAMPL